MRIQDCDHTLPASSHHPGDDCGTRGLPDVPLAGLLDALTGFTRRYVALASSAQATAVALWIAHTHVIDYIEATPYLAITSPEKRSGKSRLLDVLDLVVRAPWRTVSPSEATVYRKVADDRPTLLLDEVDTIFGTNARDAEGLRALLNAGHRAGTTVPRCVNAGGTIIVDDFEVFCAKALAAIGDLPDTVADRSIPIRLARRARTEPVARFRYREAKTDAQPLRQVLSVWAATAGEAIGRARPTVPAELDDRAADGWEPLLAIADQAGGPWPQRARQAAVELHATRDETETDTSLGLRLLDELRTAFGDSPAMLTRDLLDQLVKLDDAPWAERNLTSRRLATILRNYGIRPRDVRINPHKHGKGYRREDLAPVWERYLSPPSRDPAPRTLAPVSEAGTSRDTVTSQVSSLRPVTDDPFVTHQERDGDPIRDSQHARDHACHPVTDFPPLSENEPGPVPVYTDPPAPCEVCGKRCAVTIAGRRVHVLCAPRTAPE